MRILIYGAGVIGSFYASRFAKAGLDVTIYARGQRLKELQGHGLWYRGKTRIHKVEVKTIGELKPDDRYQFIFLTVRENQAEEALKELKENQSPNGKKSVERAGSSRHFREREDVLTEVSWMHSCYRGRYSQLHLVRLAEERAAEKRRLLTFSEKAIFRIRSFRRCITGRSHIWV